MARDADLVIRARRGPLECKRTLDVMAIDACTGIEVDSGDADERQHEGRSVAGRFGDCERSGPMVGCGCDVDVRAQLPRKHSVNLGKDPGVVLRVCERLRERLNERRSRG